MSFFRRSLVGLCGAVWSLASLTAGASTVEATVVDNGTDTHVAEPGEAKATADKRTWALSTSVRLESDGTLWVPRIEPATREGRAEAWIRLALPPMRASNTEHELVITFEVADNDQPRVSSGQSQVPYEPILMGDRRTRSSVRLWWQVDGESIGLGGTCVLARDYPGGFWGDQFCSVADDGTITLRKSFIPREESGYTDVHVVLTSTVTLDARDPWASSQGTVTVASVAITPLT